MRWAKLNTGRLTVKRPDDPDHGKVKLFLTSGLTGRPITFPNLRKARRIGMGTPVPYPRKFTVLTMTPLLGSIALLLLEHV